MSEVPRHIGHFKLKMPLDVELYDIDQHGNRLYRLKLFGEYHYVTQDQLKGDLTPWK